MNQVMKFLPTSMALLASAALVFAANPLVTWDFTFLDGWEKGKILAPYGVVASVEDVGSSSGVNLSDAGIFPTNIGPSLGGNGVLPYNLGTADNDVLNATGFLTAPDSGRFISFAFTMGTSFPTEFSFLDSITLDLANTTSQPKGIEVLYRINANSFVSLGQTFTPSNSPQQFGKFSFSLNPMVSLSPGDVAEFRVLGFAESTSASLQFDNVIISAIPEPVKVTLIAGIGILCWRIRRAMVRL